MLTILPIFWMFFSFFTLFVFVIWSFFDCIFPFFFWKIAPLSSCFRTVPDTQYSQVKTKNAQASVNLCCKKNCYAKDFWKYFWKRKTSFFKWNMFHISETTPENARQILKYLLLEKELSYQKQIVLVFEGKKRKFFC